jgi:DNA-binding MarR family transcriptional regulator
LTITGGHEIVKPLDDNPYPPLIDHIGVALWQAAQGWKAEFDRRMVARGHPLFAEAAAGLLAYVGPNGVGQSNLARRMAITKQAAQQFVDQLVARGVVERLPDPKDARGRLVVLSPAGRQMLSEANAVKQAIEAEYRSRLGDAQFSALQQALAALARKSGG